jgi:hypothetical protein
MPTIAAERTIAVMLPVMVDPLCDAPCIATDMARVTQLKSSPRSRPTGRPWSQDVFVGHQNGAIEREGESAPRMRFSPAARRSVRFSVRTML